MVLSYHQQQQQQNSNNNSNNNNNNKVYLRTPPASCGQHYDETLNTIAHRY